jgi:hypothetical protein
MACYIVFHDGQLLAMYNRKQDVKESMQLILEMHSNKMEYLRKYTLFELKETLPHSGVFNKRWPIDIEKLIKENDDAG